MARKARKPPRSRKPGRLRRALKWTFRLAAALAGIWLIYEAWRFPRIAPLATERPGRTSFQEYRIAEARAAGRPYTLTQNWVDLEAMARPLRRAVLSAEDDRFYAHEGFDTAEMKDALEDHFEKGKKLRGASTLSQQLAKNLWLGPERSLLRKLREAVYTFALERRLEKDRILELYLNVVEWGPGVFGAEAAARHHFGVSARNLDLRQSCLLAAALPNPLKRDPAHPSPGLERRARWIRSRLAESGPDSGATPAPSPSAPDHVSPTPAPESAAAGPGPGSGSASAAPDASPVAPIVAVPDPGPPVDLLAIPTPR